MDTAHCLGLPEMPSAVPLQSCLVPPRPYTPAAQFRARKGTERAGATWACCMGVGSLKQGLSDHLPFPVAPDGKTPPGLPLWHPLRD